MNSVARHILIRGVVQGVGFRPFVYRLAHEHGVAGWVRNGEIGVEIHAQAAPDALLGFERALQTHAPPAARIAAILARDVPAETLDGFRIVASERRDRPTVRIAPDLPVCEACLTELRDPADRRHDYPYINCTDCGPRYSIVLGLPYDRPKTTMKDWPMCAQCAAEYDDPLDRRFHAQPTACPACGPTFHLRVGDKIVSEGRDAIAAAAQLIRDGGVCAVKGLGGYHLACDARNEAAVGALRDRKYRKEKPFALMTRDLEAAERLVKLSPAAKALMQDVARPIVLAPAKVELPGVAPNNRELGVMLPYTPVHHLLFDCGAPDALVMTSANKSNEPLVYRDEDAFEQLSGLADAFLVGERAIARRVDDSVTRVGPFGPVVLRRARGYAPGVVASLPTTQPIIAVGADLKNTVTLAIDGQAIVSQYVGDLDYRDALLSFEATVRDLLAVYEVRPHEALLVHDQHPTYASSRYAEKWDGPRLAVQHHRAHIASVLAEHGVWDERVVGVAFDGTGYGDDGSIWGGEVFVGSLREGLTRVAHLTPAMLPGGDAAARFPEQAAAGFLAALDGLPDLGAPPFGFSERYAQAAQLARLNVRCFPTTSMGRLFDTAAALLGFTREISFEGQAAIGLEQLALDGAGDDVYPFDNLDYRPLLAAVISDRLCGRAPADIALAFHRGVARGMWGVVRRLCTDKHIATVALSGGVFQNALLLELLHELSLGDAVRILTNQNTPPNDGGISLGQAALAAGTIG